MLRVQFLGGKRGGSSTVKRSVGQRRFHAFGIGAAKSGTHSIAALFGGQYASDHEAGHSAMIKATFARVTGAMTDAQADRFIRDRDKHLKLEMDSSQLHCPFLDVMVRLFPEARFILTIRDCYGFLNSVIDHQLARPVSKSWQRLRHLRFSGFGYSPHEKALAERGLFTIDGYLSYWFRHNQMALSHVPDDRLLIVKTKQISADIDKIAAFLGVSPQTLDTQAAHAYPAQQRYGLLAKIDPKFLQDRVDAQCASLMRRFYPGEMDANAAVERLSDGR
ncbi:MAG TPA: sulfotransferase [Humisphaera sp.]|jgi:hypothetical protein|nr:sulfotransferase [Humisphaera sp.]